MPVFVKIDEYEDVLRTMSTLRNKIESAKTTLTRINQLKREEDSQLQSWQTALSEIENRLKGIGQLLNEPERF